MALIVTIVKWQLYFLYKCKVIFLFHQIIQRKNVM
nr:MAG TPA: hypothetical protein [Caudoviricetes sp.]